MKNRIATVAASLFLASSLAAPALADTLATPLNSDNNQSGIMFDVVVGSQSLVLQSLGVNITGGTYDFKFYTIDGGIGSNQNNAAAWTLRDSFSGVTSAGTDNLTNFDIADFGVTAGSTIGFYFTGTVPYTGIVRYTNGNAVGDIVASNSALSILSGYGKSYPFAENFSPRDFNGAITYAVAGVPEPAIWALMILGFGTIGFAMRRAQARSDVRFDAKIKRIAAHAQA